MKGIHVKQKLKEQNISIHDIAPKIGMSVDDLNTQLSSDTVDCGLLKQIEKAANKSIFFVTENVAPAISGNNNLLGDNNNIDCREVTLQFIDLIKRKDDQISKKDDQINHLMNIIDSLTKK